MEFVAYIPTSGRVLRPLPRGGSILVATLPAIPPAIPPVILVASVAVTVLLLAVAALHHLAAVVVATTLPDVMTGMRGVITIVMTGIPIAATVTLTVETGIATAVIAIVNALVTVPVAPMTGTVMSRMTGNDAMMIGSAVTTSVKTSPMVKTGKVCKAPLNVKAATHNQQYPWTPCLLLMMSLILLSRSTQCHVLSSRTPLPMPGIHADKLVSLHECH